MTRPSRREIETCLDDLEGSHSSDRFGDGPQRTVYRDPVSGRCFESMETDADPVENLPDGANLLIMNRKQAMMRTEAEDRGWDVIEVLRDHGTSQMVAVRIEPAPEVDVETAVQIPEEEVWTVADFSEAQI